MVAKHSRRHAFWLTLAGGSLAGIDRVDGAITSATILKRARKFRWIESQTGEIDLSVEAGSRAEREIDRVKRWLASSQERIEQVLGEPLKPRVRSFIAGSVATSKALIGHPLNGFSIAPIAVMVYSDSVNAIGPHELCHAWANSLWGRSSGEWIDEGLAVHSDGHWRGLPLHKVAKWLLDRGKLLPIGALIGKRWSKGGYPAGITYPESGSFVTFILEKYSREAVKTYWQRGAAAGEAVLGKPLLAVEREWLRELSTIDAGDVRYEI
jgi:hypothetical protein